MSPRRIAKLLAGVGAVALAVLLIVTVWIVHQRDAVEALEKVAGMVPGSLLHARNFRWTQMKAGERQWVLTASDASYSSTRTGLALTNANLTMTSSDGKPVRVEAPRALIHLKGNHVTRAELSGGTTIHYGDFVLVTDSATYLPDEDRVEASGAVTIEGEGMKVTGIGLTGNTRTRQFVLHDQVQTEIIPRKNGEKPTPS
jgi:lipopolysaccharide export system protein LptC